MTNFNELLIELIEELIHTKREDDWWDFKQCHYEDRASLLHDIICLANNRVNRDAYLILGVEDNTFNIIGVENDPKRKNQQNIVDYPYVFQHFFQFEKLLQTCLLKTLYNFHLDIFDR